MRVEKYKKILSDRLFSDKITTNLKSDFLSVSKRLVNGSYIRINSAETEKNHIITYSADKEHSHFFPSLPPQARQAAPDNDANGTVALKGAPHPCH